jgi:hypothetical protein
MNQFNFKTLLLLLIPTIALELNNTIKDITNPEQCDQYGLNHCNRCFDINSEYSPFIEATPLCYECSNDGDYYWVAGACVDLPDARTINGWGRTCAECGKGNFWSPTNSKCMPCKYEAAHCPSGKCCDENEDFECTPTFTLNPETKRCECEKGEHFKVFDKCYGNGQEDVYLDTDNDKSIKVKKCVNRCPTGCEKYDCGKGFFLDGCECKPVHYSCQDADSDSEINCRECKAPFEFVEISNNVKKCLCPCCTIESGEICSSPDQECLESKRIDFSLLDEWITGANSSCQYTSIYKKSVDGFANFHAFCDNKGPILVVAKVDNNRVVGAYTERSWDKSIIAVEDSNAFVFSLTTGKEEAFKSNAYELLSNDAYYQIGVKSGEERVSSIYLVDRFGAIKFVDVETTIALFGEDYSHFNLLDYEAYSVIC